MVEDEIPNWEATLQQHTNEWLSARLEPLKNELERLQAGFIEVSALVQEQARVAATPEETSALTAHVRNLISASTAKIELEAQERLSKDIEKARNETAIVIRQQLETEFQASLEQNNVTIRQEAEAELATLRAELAALIASQENLIVASAPEAAAVNYNLIKTAIDEIDNQRTQSETLSTLINRAAQFAPRVAFYVVKSGDAVGWKAFGFDNGLSDETARSLAVSIQAPSLIGQALNEQRTTIALNPSQAEISTVLGRFSHPVPQGAVAIPLVVRGKAAAVLYADSGSASDDAIQLEAIESLIQVASMAIELLPVRRNAGDVGRPQPATQSTQPPATAQPDNTPTIAEAPQAEVETYEAEAAHITSGTPAPEVAHEEIQSETPELSVTIESAEEPVATDFSPITQKPMEFTASDYATDPVTNRQGEQFLPPEEANPTTEEHISESDSIFQRLQESESEASTQTSETYAPPPEPEYNDAPPLIPNVALDEPTTSEGKPSIFELLRPSSGDTDNTTSTPGVSLPGYSAPEQPPMMSFSGDRSNSPLPEWMQRLQEDTTEEVPSATPVTVTSPWDGNEGAYKTLPPEAPPAPPTPPPFRAAPSLSETAMRSDSAETERLTNTPQIAQFQVDSPSVRFSIDQPSEPPRYAAPSLSVSNAATETEVRAHNDARRFARLLVSEIKLYNAAKVNEGRRQIDLYDRLKDEIDRSRKVYDKRVSPTVAAKFDYFYDELVQTLAEGDPSKLGESCPGPVIFSP